MEQKSPAGTMHTKWVKKSFDVVKSLRLQKGCQDERDKNIMRL